MSMVRVIVGLIIVIAFPALQTIRSRNQLAVTQSNLQSLMRATAAYVQAKCCLPCPATQKSLVKGDFGNIAGLANPASACGVCSAKLAEGIPPYVALGIPSSIAHDGWGHWIRMRTDPALVVNFSGIAPKGNGGLCQTGLNLANRIQIFTPALFTQQAAAVVFISHGADGYGAHVAPSPNNQTLNFPARKQAVRQMAISKLVMPTIPKIIITSITEQSWAAIIRLMINCFSLIAIIWLLISATILAVPLGNKGWDENCSNTANHSNYS